MLAGKGFKQEAQQPWFCETIVKHFNSNYFDAQAYANDYFNMASQMICTMKTYFNNEIQSDIVNTLKKQRRDAEAMQVANRPKQPPTLSREWLRGTASCIILHSCSSRCLPIAA